MPRRLIAKRFRQVWSSEKLKDLTDIWKNWITVITIVMFRNIISLTPQVFWRVSIHHVIGGELVTCFAEREYKIKCRSQNSGPLTLFDSSSLQKNIQFLNKKNLSTPSLPNSTIWTVVSRKIDWIVTRSNIPENRISYLPFSSLDFNLFSKRCRRYERSKKSLDIFWIFYNAINFLLLLLLYH